jgi:hypothetical protein
VNNCILQLPRSCLSSGYPSRGSAVLRVASSGWQHLLFKRLKDVCRGLVTVHCCARREFIHNMKSEWIPHHWEHEFLRVNVVIGLCSHVISGQDPHPTCRIGHKKPRLVSCDKMIPVISRRGC